MSNTAKVTNVQRLFLNGTLIGTYPTAGLAEQAAIARGPGAYDIVPVTLDVVTADPVPPTESTPGTTVLAGSTAAIIDGAGNHWTITPTHQVAINGAADPTTANVTELAYVNGVVWQENAAKLWWQATAKDGWQPPGGTTSPFAAPAPPAPPQPPVAGTPTDAYIIYQNGNFAWFANGGGDYNSGAIADYEYANGAPGNETKCLQISTTEKWGEWLPYYKANPGPFLDISKVCNGKQAKSLQFKFKATKPDQSISVYAISAGDAAPPPSVPGYRSQPGAFPVGQWITVTIALASMGLGPDQTFSGNELYKFAIQDQTGLASNVWYVDDVLLLP